MQVTLHGTQKKLLPFRYAVSPLNAENWTVAAALYLLDRNKR
jgi:hypothetical protein